MLLESICMKEKEPERWICRWWTCLLLHQVGSVRHQMIAWHFCAVVTRAHVHTWKNQGGREVRKTETKGQKNETISGTNNWNIQGQNDSYQDGEIMLNWKFSLSALPWLEFPLHACTHIHTHTHTHFSETTCQVHPIQLSAALLGFKQGHLHI